MGWFSGRYDDQNDASSANTISDKEYRAIQARAGRAHNHDRGKLGSEQQQAGAKRGADNYNNRWWN